MNLPANLPVIASAGTAARADRSAQDEAAAAKFDDMLAPKSGKGARESASEDADSRKTTWSWTRIELPKNRMEWSAATDQTAGDPVAEEAADAETPQAGANDGKEAPNEDWSSESQDTEQPGSIVQITGMPEDEATAGQQAVRLSADAGDPNSAHPEDPDQEAREVGRTSAQVAELTAAMDAQTRQPLSGEVESRQGAAIVAGEDRRLDPRLTARERLSSTADRSETALREATRAAPADGERLSPRSGLQDGMRTTEGQSSALSRSEGRMRDEQMRPDPFAQRVTVVASQTAPLTPPTPALASLGLSNASMQVVSAIRQDVGEASRAAMASIEAQDVASGRNQPVKTLQIQLQPADLGRVNARMSIDGSQLRVELQVETEQARAALAKDADSILKALKSAGFEIERVTIQQAQPASNAAQPGTQERGAASFAAQGGGADESGSQGNQRGTGNHAGHAPQEGHDGASQMDTRGGLFI